MKTQKLKVYGRVQGVFFRVNIKKIADKLGIVGSVCNKDDGSVEIIAQGDKLEEFIDRIKRSPGMSRVLDVRSEKIELDKFEKFKVNKDSNIFKDKKKAIRNLMSRFCFA